MTHPRARLHESLASPVRLSLLAALLDVDDLESSAVRDLLGLSDAAVSKHMNVLADADLVAIRKGYVGKRPRTWLAATPAGRQAYKRHRAALLDILGTTG